MNTWFTREDSNLVFCIQGRSDDRYTIDEPQLSRAGEIEKSLLFNNCNLYLTVFSSGSCLFILLIGYQSKHLWSKYGVIGMQSSTELTFSCRMDDLMNVASTGVYLLVYKNRSVSIPYSLALRFSAAP